MMNECPACMSTKMVAVRETNTRTISMYTEFKFLYQPLDPKPAGAYGLVVANDSSKGTSRVNSKLVTRLECQQCGYAFPIDGFVVEDWQSDPIPLEQQLEMFPIEERGPERVPLLKDNFSITNPVDPQTG